MKALVLETAGRLVLKDCPKPVPNVGEVLFKTKAAAICTGTVEALDLTAGKKSETLKVSMIFD